MSGSVGHLRPTIVATTTGACTCTSTLRNSTPAERATAPTVFSCVASRKCVSHSQLAGSTLRQPLPYLPTAGSRNSTARRRLKEKIIQKRDSLLNKIFPRRADKNREQETRSNPCGSKSRAGRSHPRRRPATARCLFPASLAPTRIISAQPTANGSARFPTPAVARGAFHPSPAGISSRFCSPQNE